MSSPLRTSLAVCLTVVGCLAYERPLRAWQTSSSWLALALQQPVSGTKKKTPSTTSTTAQTLQKQDEGTTDKEVLEAFQQQWDDVTQRLQAQKSPLPELHRETGRIVTLIDRAAVGIFYQQGPTRYFALHLRIFNGTKEPVTIERSAITAEIDGTKYTTEEIKPPLLHHGFSFGNEHLSLQQCQPVAKFTAPPGGLAGTWLIYHGLPANGDIPPTSVTVQLGQQSLTLDVHAIQRAVMQLDSDVIGPKPGIALLTIGGVASTFNVQSLIDEMETQIAQKIVRTVIRWSPDAPQQDGQVINWLQQSAQALGQNRGFNNQLPQFPGGLREIHLVMPSKSNASSYNNYQNRGPARLHTSDVDAVYAALRGTLLTLPQSDLRQQLQTGHPLARAAALIHGAPLLDASDLPAVLQYSRDSEDVIRRAALHALGDFAHLAAARERLEVVGRSQDDGDAQAAIAALASSRYSEGPATIHRWIAEEPADRKLRLVNVLADRPQPEWSQVLFDHVRGPDGELRVEVLRALVALDHPQLVDLLETALKSPQKSLRDFAFPILSQRTDERSEALSIAYVQTFLDENPPDGSVMEFLNRTKDTRALPALMRQLSSARDKASLINLLGQMGDEKTAVALARQYPQAKPHEQAATLNALRMLRHEAFVPLAETALASTDGSLLSAATQGLSQDGSDAAVAALCRALPQQKQAYGISMICNSLAAIGTKAAREALLTQRASTEPQRKTAGTQALQNLQQRSPAYNYIHQAKAHLQNKQEKEAIELFGIALQIDPQLADAYLGRGELALKKEKWADAASDLGKAYELDQYNGLACSGYAVALIMQDQSAKALETIEAARERLTGDVNFHYNAGCVYGRIVEKLIADPEAKDRDARLAAGRKQALADLEAGVKAGYKDFTWMRKDPDLKSLHDLPEFQKLAKGPAGAANDATPEDDEN